MNVQHALIGLWLLLNLAALPLSYAAEPEVGATGTTAPTSLRGLSTINETPSVSTTAPVQPSATSRTPNVYRDLPTISSRYSVGGTTLMPYVGAGFGNGYTSDLDRSLNGGASALGDTSLRNLFGTQNLTPNEVRLGIRIPF